MHFSQQVFNMNICLNFYLRHLFLIQFFIVQKRRRFVINEHYFCVAAYTQEKPRAERHAAHLLSAEIPVDYPYHHIIQLLDIIRADRRLDMPVTDAAVVREERVCSAGDERHGS